VVDVLSVVVVPSVVSPVEVLMVPSVVVVSPVVSPELPSAVVPSVDPVGELASLVPVVVVAVVAMVSSTSLLHPPSATKGVRIANVLQSSCRISQIVSACIEVPLGTQCPRLVTTLGL